MLKKTWKRCLFGLLSMPMMACGEDRLSKRGGAFSQKEPSPNLESCQGASCGDQGGGSQENPIQPEPQGPLGTDVAEVVLGLFGGYTSCETDDNNKPDPKLESFDGMTQEIQKAIGTQKISLYFKTCYNLNPTQIHYRLEKSTPTVSTSIASGIRGLIGEIAKKGKTKVYLIGHSYGGWTVMELVKNLPPDIKVASLTTIDPISVRECTPNGFIFSGGMSPACQKAPGDFSANDIDTIKSKVNIWTNFYQTDVTALHSGPILGAENVKKSYDSPDFEPHSDFLDDPSVIETIAGHIH